MTMNKKSKEPVVPKVRNPVPGLLVMCESFLDGAKRDIAEWKEKFEKDPAYALSWSRGTFHSAAVLRVYGQVVSKLRAGTPIKALYTGYLAMLSSSAGQSYRSSSPASNMMADAEVAVYANVVDTLGALVETEEKFKAQENG